jgi:hypothetical protein
MVLGDGIEVRELCRQIEEEKDPHRFTELVKRLNDLLDGKLAGEKRSEQQEDK